MYKRQHHRLEAEGDALAFHTELTASMVRHAWLLRFMSVILPATITQRDAELWRPLFSIACLAGGDWPARVTYAAEALTGHTQDPAVVLLGALRELFAPDGHDRLRTAAILAALEARDDLPWGTTTGPLTALNLARLLARFAIKPRTLRFPGGSQAKGYLRSDFQEAWTRYTPLP